MRQTISGLVAALAVMIAGAAPAMACGGGLFQGSCSPCGQAYVEPCAQPQVYVPPAPVYSGCNTCGNWGYERLADPATQYYATPMQHQYYYVNQGPTYSGPGNFAPYPAYREAAYGPRVYGYHAHPHHRSYHHGYGYSVHPSYRYGYAPHYYGYRHVLRRYY